MTMEINNQQDFLRALDTDPVFREAVRRHLLTDDLINLPGQFAQLVNVVSELTEAFNTFAANTDRRLSALENDVGTLKSDVSTLKSDVSTLKSDVSTLKSDVSALKSDVGILKSDVATLTGSDIERRARGSILNVAKDELNLTRGRILLAQGRDTEPQFLETIHTAEDRGLITEQQADNILVADIIIRGRRQHDRQYVHAVFEVSRTIRNHDIQRAHDRAAAVAAATGEETIAAVIGQVIQPPQHAQADALDVRALIPAMFSAAESTNS